MFGQIISIIKGNQNLEPLFYKVNIENKFEEIIVMKENCNSGDLYKVTYKTINYYNQKGELIKSLSKYCKKEFIKQIKAIGSIIVNGIKIIGITGMMILSASLLVQEGIANSIYKATDNLKNDYRYLINKDFKEKIIMKELLIDTNF